jgi:hypothetical protein
MERIIASASVATALPRACSYPRAATTLLHRLVMGADMAVQRGLLTVLGVADVALVGLEPEMEALVLGARPLLGEALVAVPALEGLLAGVRAPVGLQMFLHLNIQAVCVMFIPEIKRDRTSLQFCKLQARFLGIAHYQGWCEGYAKNFRANT